MWPVSAANRRFSVTLCVSASLICNCCTVEHEPTPPALNPPVAANAREGPAGPPAGLGPAAADTSLQPRRAQAQIVPGTGLLLGEPPPPPAARVDVAGDGGISFNFVNADVREVLRETVGEQLHVGYAVDPRVQAVITAQTGGPLPRQAVLPAIEAILRANGLGMVETAGIYRVFPVEDAAKNSLGGAPQNQAGFGIRVIPLRFVSPAELKSVLDPYAPPGGSIQIDGARNLLIVHGSRSDLNGIESLVKQFDVDWLAGTSFAIYPLRIGTAKEVAGELGNIFGEGGSGPLAGVVRIVALDRLNAILVISPQRRYLQDVKKWVDRLDYGDDETTPRLFQYRVQNSRAVDLAAVLTKLLSSGQVGTVQPEIAPGARSTTLIPQSGQSGSGSLNAPGGGPPSGLMGGLPSRGGTSRNAPPAGIALGQGGAQGQSARNTIDQALGPGDGIGTNQGSSGLEPPAVRVVADEKNNALVTYARPRDYRMIEDVIRRLDIVPLQVLIEATVAEVTLTDELSYGLQFFLKRGANIVDLTRPTIRTAPTNGTGGIADIASVFPGFNYVLSTGSARAILNLLSSVSHVDVVSSPQLLVMDHQTAALQVGDQVPIVTQSATSVLTTGAPLVNSIDYRNTGVLLQVTPRVNASGLITLEIDQEVSDVKTTTTSGIDSPTITERRIVSSVITQDGETIALGGLILDKQDNERSGIPFLSDIPVVGPLFRSTTKSRGRTELLVLLSPKIIR
ncbi:MAG: gspD, partial [Rhodospirillales bacterium]|nr:gspD [Rhodospirillales bacterium]